MLEVGPAVLADVPVLQRQFQALGACRTGDTDRDRVGGLAAWYFLVGTNRKPFVRIKGAVGAQAVTGHCFPYRAIGQPPGWLRVTRGTCDAFHVRALLPGPTSCRPRQSAWLPPAALS